MKRRAARGVSVNDAHHQLGKLLGVNVRVLGQGRNKKKSGQVDPNFYSDRARMQGLRNLARAVFRTRNARGMPKKYRLTVKSAARPELRQTIKHTRQARDALRVGNIGRFDHMRDKAQKHLALACKHFSWPVMEERAKWEAEFARGRDKGGKRQNMSDRERRRKQRIAEERAHFRLQPWELAPSEAGNWRSPWPESSAGHAAWTQAQKWRRAWPPSRRSLPRSKKHSRPSRRNWRRLSRKLSKTNNFPAREARRRLGKVGQRQPAEPARDIRFAAGIYFFKGMTRPVHSRHFAYRSPRSAAA